MSPIVARLVGKVDLRALVAFGVLWISMVAFWRSGFTTEATFWQIALPQLVLGIGIPFVFIPTTTLSLSSVPPEETAAAAGMQNFLRTTAAAFATSIMTTSWENAANVKRAGLAGALNDPQGVQGTLVAQGFTPDQALSQIEAIAQTQAVMLSTNQMFLTVALVLILAAMLIWVAPSVKRTGAPAGGGH
jgi:DHA2 family multidrug resistance protein